jgi:hypothetical protein
MTSVTGLSTSKHTIKSSSIRQIKVTNTRLFHPLTVAQGKAYRMINVLLVCDTVKTPWCVPPKECRAGFFRHTSGICARCVSKYVFWCPSLACAYQGQLLDWVCAGGRMHSHRWTAMPQGWCGHLSGGSAELPRRLSQALKKGLDHGLLVSFS